MEEFVYFNNLYDLYKELLTDRQRQYFVDYYQNNLTLSEIGENNNVSRNAVHKQLKDTIKLLESYEQKLKLFSKFTKIFEIIRKTNNEDLINKIERVIEG